jgi:hypothetical protein
MLYLSMAFYRRLLNERSKRRKKSDSLQPITFFIYYAYTLQKVLSPTTKRSPEGRALLGFLEPKLWHL